MHFQTVAHEQLAFSIINNVTFVVMLLYLNIQLNAQPKDDCLHFVKLLNSYSLD